MKFRLNCVEILLVLVNYIHLYRIFFTNNKKSQTQPHAALETLYCGPFTVSENSPFWRKLTES
jgi:hypothetical protein